MNHRIFQGTSVSAPHVTGAVALLLQKFGAMSPQQATTYLRNHARADGFTGIVPSKEWGYGKLNLGDLIDPVVHVVSPNGGERPATGATLRIVWTATDSLGSVAGVDLQLSRTGPGGPFENVALGIPNSGTYDWMVTGPATNPNAAYIRVLAHDTNSNVAGDLSDAGFTIVNALAVGEDETAVFALSRVSPNPGTGRTYVEFSVARESHVRLSVCDVQGRSVAVLADGIYRAGRHRATWEGMQGSARVPAGLYFVRYDTPIGRFARRISVAR